MNPPAALFVLVGTWLSYVAHTFQVTYEYEGSDGAPVQAREFSRAQFSVPIGDAHEILVNPEKPDTVRQPGVGHYTTGPILLAIGLAALVTMVSVAYD